jgi:hypothetical protein
MSRTPRPNQPGPPPGAFAARPDGRRAARAGWAGWAATPPRAAEPPRRPGLHEVASSAPAHRATVPPGTEGRPCRRGRRVTVPPGPEGHRASRPAHCPSLSPEPPRPGLHTVPTLGLNLTRPGPHIVPSPSRSPAPRPRRYLSPRPRPTLGRSGPTQTPRPQQSQSAPLITPADCPAPIGRPEIKLDLDRCSFTPLLGGANVHRSWKRPAPDSRPVSPGPARGRGRPAQV